MPDDFVRFESLIRLSGSFLGVSPSSLLLLLCCPLGKFLLVE